MSCPRGFLTGDAKPASITIFAKLSILFFVEVSKNDPGQGLNGIKLILDGIPEINLTKFLASSSVSLIPLNMTYSHVILREFDKLG